MPPTGAACSPSSAPLSVACAKPWDRWSAWGGAASPASFGPMAVSTAVGARSISSTHAASGSRSSCSAPSSKVLWRNVRNAWLAWPSTPPNCARPGAPSNRRSINAIRCRRRFISIWCWACTSCRLRCWCRCTVTPQSAPVPCRFAEGQLRKCETKELIEAPKAAEPGIAAVMCDAFLELVGRDMVHHLGEGNAASKHDQLSERLAEAPAGPRIGQRKVISKNLDRPPITMTPHGLSADAGALAGHCWRQQPFGSLFPARAAVTDGAHKPVLS